MALPIDQRAILIVGITVVVIVVVMLVRVLSGRPASNLSSRSKRNGQILARYGNKI